MTTLSSKHAEAGLLHRELGQLDGAPQAGHHHRPDDPVDLVLVELAEGSRGLRARSTKPSRRATHSTSGEAAGFLVAVCHGVSPSYSCGGIIGPSPAGSRISFLDPAVAARQHLLRRAVMALVVVGPRSPNSVSALRLAISRTAAQLDRLLLALRLLASDGVGVDDGRGDRVTARRRCPPCGRGRSACSRAWHATAPCRRRSSARACARPARRSAGGRQRPELLVGAGILSLARRRAAVATCRRTTPAFIAASAFALTSPPA